MSKKIGCASLLIRRLCMSHLLMDELHRRVMVQNTLIRPSAVPVLHGCCVGMIYLERRVWRSPINESCPRMEDE